MRALVLGGPSAAPPVSRGHRGPSAPRLTLVDVLEPRPHAPGWVVVAPSLSGITDRDLRACHGRNGALDLTLRGDGDGCVPGSEIVGVVTAVAPGTRGVAEGARVLVDPVLNCLHKALPACRRCRSGEAHRCENADRAGRIASGARVGRSTTTGGGWSDAVLVHDTMVVDQGSLSDQRAVLAVPAAVALTAARAWSGRGDRVGVVGAGLPALLLIAALRRLHPALEIFSIDPAAGIDAGMPARRAGASRVWRGVPDEIFEGIAHATSARMLLVGGFELPVLDGGLDAVFDTTGDLGALGLRLLRAGGTLVAAGELVPDVVDWPLVVARELTVRGRSVHAPGPDGRPAVAAARDWLSDPSLPVDALVTHRFPMEQHAEAIAVAAAAPGNGACRVVFVGPASKVTRATTGIAGTRGDADRVMGLLGRLRSLPARAGSR